MLTLIELQKKFSDGLNIEDNDILNYIRDDMKLSAKEHLQIYQNSIFGAKQKTLKDIYSVCFKLVGQEFFIAMINEYIPKNKSQSADLANYGAHFADFICTYQPAKCLPYLADVARLEWAWHQLFYSPDPKGINFQELEKYYIASPEKIIFCLSPGSTIISSPYPIHQIWAANQDDNNNDQTIVLSENEMFYFFVWRNGLQMRIDLLNPDEWQILTWIKNKPSFNELCTKIDDELPNVNFVELLPNLIRQGWLSEFAISR